jgi:BirA family biotin operon repressor/biotin-[acetyl-CoA-carboxylase] ligase
VPASLEPVLLTAERTERWPRPAGARSWHSGAGGEPAAGGRRPEGPASLTFSLGLPLAPASWSGLSLAIGVALAESLHPDVRIKWPNDLWWQDRKLAGVLVETAAAPGLSGDQRQAVIGVGINILPPDAAGLSTPAAWLQELSPSLDAPAALGRVAPALVAMVQTFKAGGFAPLRARFQARDALAGRMKRARSRARWAARGRLIRRHRCPARGRKA